MEIKMNIKIIEDQLKGLNGYSFEEHARFLLCIVYPNFIFTRKCRDGKIDGLAKKV